MCEVSAKLTQYIGDKQRVLKMLFTWQILLTCNCNCWFFYTKHTLLYSLNHIHISAITNSKFKKSTVSDMHYRIRYMHVKYQLNRDKRFVKTVNTKNKLNCMNLQLQIAIFKDWPFQTCIIVKRTCISIFSKIGLVDQSKLCTQIYLQKFANCINLQLTIRILKNHDFRTCTTPSRTFRPILRSIGLLDNELPRKEIISTYDRRTDRRTDVAHDNNR